MISGLLSAVSRRQYRACAGDIGSPTQNTYKMTLNKRPSDLVQGSCDSLANLQNVKLREYRQAMHIIAVHVTYSEDILFWAEAYVTKLARRVYSQDPDFNRRNACLYYCNGHLHYGFFSYCARLVSLVGT